MPEPRTPKRRGALVAIGVLVVLALLVWMSDEITLQGERTIYTVNCEHGDWRGSLCTGTMVAGDRYRYRAFKSRNEVIFWISGSSLPSGRYTDCEVRNRGNWSCNARADAPPSITLQMQNDRATHGPIGLTVPFHAVPKWTWWLMRANLKTFHEAPY